MKCAFNQVLPLHLFVLFWIAACGAYMPAHGADVRKITLLNEDVLSLADFRVESGSCVGTHSILGEIRISPEDIASVEPPLPCRNETESANQSASRNVDAKAPSQDAPVHSEHPGWKRNISASLSGSEGEGDGVNARVGLEAARLTGRMRTQLKAIYVHSKDDVGAQRSRPDADARNDWLITDSRWRIFAIGRAEYDEYADWNWRTTASSGLGYEFIETSEHELVGRSGGGASQTFGGGDDALVPIGVLGLDYTWRISDRSALATAVDFTPDLSKPTEFRTESAAAYRVRIKEDQPLTLQIGSGHRYDSTASDAEKSDYEYFMSLGWYF